MSVAFGPASAGRGAALVTNANTVTPFSQVKPRQKFRDARRDRFTRRAQSSRWLVDVAVEDHGREHFAEHAPRPATCGWAAGDHVGVHRSSNSPARFSGVQSCASIWACAPCSALIRTRRAEEVKAAADWWESVKGQFLFLTLTVRHKLGDPLERTMDAVSGGFTRLINGAPWKRFSRRHGIRHFIKSQEVTLSWDNGWHAHLHVLLFVDLDGAAVDLLEDARQAWREVSENLTASGARNKARVKKAVRRTDDAKVARRAAAQGIGLERKSEIHGWLVERWGDMVEAAGGRRPDEKHGVDIRTVRDGDVVALYIAKLQEGDGVDQEVKGWGIGQEMARQDLKRGRKRSMVPLELLDVDGLTDVVLEQHRQWWLEFVTSTKGRRAMTWSRGLKDLAGIAEVEDEEIIEGEEAEILEDDRVIVIQKRHWRIVRDDPDALSKILEYVEDGDLEKISRFVPWEYPPKLTSPPLRRVPDAQAEGVAAARVRVNTRDSRAESAFKRAAKARAAAAKI